MDRCLALDNSRSLLCPRSCYLIAPGGKLTLATAVEKPTQGTNKLHYVANAGATANAH